MKKYIALFIALFSLDVSACDICGCAASPPGDGLLTSNQYHFIGLRFNYNGFQSVHRNLFTQEASTSREQFFRASVAGRWQFARRFNVQVDIPYVYNMQYTALKNSKQQGLGDLSLQFNWMFVNSKTKHDASNVLILGAGAKAPTGQYSRDVLETSNMFPGTGSWDPRISLSYRFSKKKVKLLVENLFILKTENKVGYRYGDLASSRASFYYAFEMKKNKQLLPALGLNYQFTNADRIDGTAVSHSFNSGQKLDIEIGANYFTNRWMLNTKWSYPMYQSLAGGDVSSKGAFEIGIHYLIQKK